MNQTERNSLRHSAAAQRDAASMEEKTRTAHQIQLPLGRFRHRRPLEALLSINCRNFHIGVGRGVGEAILESSDKVRHGGGIQPVCAVDFAPFIV